MKIFFAVVCLVATCSSTYSQTRQGTWELSLSGNLGSASGSSETSGSFGSYTTDQEAQGYLSLAFRPGFYLIGGLEIEPEILWTAMKNIPPSFSLSGNLAYNFNIPQSRLTPFVLAGYGIGNAVPIFQRVIVRTSDKLDIGVMNAGAGLKIFVADRIALRTEYRYQRYSGEKAYGSLYTVKTHQNFHNVFFGFSVFLP